MRNSSALLVTGILLSFCAQAGTIPAAKLTGDAGYIRLAQDSLEFEANTVYLATIKVKGQIRPGLSDHLIELWNAPQVEYSDYWFSDEPGWTTINRLIKPNQTGEYGFRLSLWSTRLLIVQEVKISAIETAEVDLIRNGTFEFGLDYWYADGGELELIDADQNGSVFSPGTEVAYIRFDSAQEVLRAFQGHSVVLLIPTNDIFPVDDQIVYDILDRLDKSWLFFERTTGFRPPSPGTRINGWNITKPTLAVVESTCGAGCGLIGANGIEIGRGIWEQTYNNFIGAQGTRGVFEYEMGRNFWAFGPQLHAPESPNYHLATAFATIMGYLAGVAAGSTAEAGDELVDWVQTFRDGYAAYADDPDFSILLAGGIDAERIHGGLWLELMESRTTFFFPRYFRALSSMETADNLLDAVANQIIAASVGVGENLIAFFESLDFPIRTGLSDAIDDALKSQPILSMAVDIELRTIAEAIQKITPTANSIHPFGDEIPLELIVLDSIPFNQMIVSSERGSIFLKPDTVVTSPVAIPFLISDPFGNLDEGEIFLSILPDEVFHDRFKRE